MDLSVLQLGGSKGLNFSPLEFDRVQIDWPFRTGNQSSAHLLTLLLVLWRPVALRCFMFSCGWGVGGVGRVDGTVIGMEWCGAGPMSTFKCERSQCCSDMQ